MEEESKHMYMAFPGTLRPSESLHAEGTPSPSVQQLLEALAAMDALRRQLLRWETQPYYAGRALSKNGHLSTTKYQIGRLKAVNVPTSALILEVSTPARGGTRLGISEAQAASDESTSDAPIESMDDSLHTRERNVCRFVSARCVLLCFHLLSYFERYYAY